MDSIDIPQYPPVIDDDNGGISPSSSPLNNSNDVPPPPPPRKRPRRRTSDLLVITNERLAQQTAITRTLESQADGVFSVLKTTYERNLNLQAHLTQAQTQVELYKHQLRMAESEIRRAEDVVKDVDRMRVQAEERSIRDREKLRKLIEERAVWIAKEEGLREGFQIGLEQGRRLVWTAEQRRRREEEEYESISSRSRGTRRSSVSSRARSPTPRPQSPPPARYPLPRTDSTSPPPRIDVRLPKVEVRPHSPPNIRHPPRVDVRSPRAEVRPHSPPHTIRPKSAPRYNPPPQQAAPTRQRAVSVSSAPRRPHTADEPIHPMPVPNRPRSPSVSRRSIVIPPDGIPMKEEGEDRIELPPPHAVSLDDDVRTPPQPRFRAHARTASSASGASTRISEYDLVSPPRGAEVRKSNHRRYNTSADVVSPQPRRMFVVANPDEQSPPQSQPSPVMEEEQPTPERKMGTPTSPTPVRKTPLAWLRSRFKRTESSPGNINIQVEPPSASQSSSSSGANTGATMVDPVLLTPDHANRPLDDVYKIKDEGPITIVLPDDNLPLGFVPQTPMMPIQVMTATAGPSTIPSMYRSPAPLNRPISLFSEE